MSRFYRTVLIATLAMLPLGLCLEDAAAAKKREVWGTYCSGADKKKDCCLTLLQDCIEDCADYTGTAIQTCIGKCKNKHKGCVDSVGITAAPGSTGTIDEPHTDQPDGPIKLSPKIFQQKR